MAALINRYPFWKYFLILIVIIAAFIYAAPNLYGEYAAVQIMGANSTQVDNQTLEAATTALQRAGLAYKDTLFQNQTLLFRFTSTDAQLKAKEVLQQALGENYLVAL